MSVRTATLLAAVLIAAAPANVQAQLSPSPSCMADDLEMLSRWKGVWLAENLHADVNGRAAPGAPAFEMVGKLFGIGAPWNDQGWSRMEPAIQRAISGNFRLAGWGFPSMMSSPAPFSIVVSPAETAIISQYSEVRHIYTDGRSHLPDDERWSTVWGDSIGCWEDDELVIETVSVKASPRFNVGLPALSEDARFVERLRLTAPDRIESRITITDAATLERPWEVHMVYTRHPVLDRLVHDGDMLENDRFLQDRNGGTIATAAEDPPSPPRPEITLTQQQIDRVAGRYAFEGAPLVLTIQRRGRRLFAQILPVEPAFMPIYAEAPLSFFSRATGATFRFIADGDGPVVGIEAKSPDGMSMPGKRLE